MRIIFKKLGYAIITSIGFSAGTWLWNEVLEDKVKDLKDRLAKTEE